MATTSIHLRLAEHVRACRVGDRLIFLDLIGSKYIGIAGPHLATLAAMILEGSGSSEALMDSSGAPALQSQVERLRAQHLLSDGLAATPEPRLVSVVEATASFEIEVDGSQHDADWRHLLRLWRATLVTAFWLRRLSLAEIAQRVGSLRASHATQRSGNAQSALLAEVAAYVHLRPLALTTHDRCLYDSLALIYFLASKGFFPRWVVGVRVNPFAAHSWVQNGETVLNDLAEHVRHYKPILIV